MDRWLENRSLKKTDVVSSNAEIAESKDTAILEPAMQSTSSSVQLQPHLQTLPSSNFGQVVSTKRRKYDTVVSGNRSEIYFIYRLTLEYLATVL
ncbi:hypothetical protein AVEN_97953-1 [Araneus ventricosus]|uniref:Uncharacterized protein n=1 Tax=Araneus ventricosus TaxID=182803 RepID=A0A4Y2T0C4_ARAVE|nr:hypothetical protein AVEN_97953-1 [Araneus ventricosus]